MAVNTRTLGRMGNRLVMSGTLEATNGTAVALADTKSRIISCFVQNRMMWKVRVLF